MKELGLHLLLLDLSSLKLIKLKNNILIINKTMGILKKLEIGYIIPSIMDFDQKGWMICDGRLLSISEYGELYGIIGDIYGGDSKETFALPDLRGRVALGAGEGYGLSGYYRAGSKGGETYNSTSLSDLPAHNHRYRLMGSSVQANKIDPTGNSFAMVSSDKKYSKNDPNVEMRLEEVVKHEKEKTENEKLDNRMPSVVVNFMINVNDRNAINLNYIGNVLLWPGQTGILPPEWHICDGKILSINSHTELFSVLGTNYGGNGFSDFALPDLRGRVAVGHLDGKMNTGESFGSEKNMISSRHLPNHTHSIKLGCTSAESESTMVENNIPGGGGNDLEYANNHPDMVMHNKCITGDDIGNQVDIQQENRQPYICMNYIICVKGNYPSRR